MKSRVIFGVNLVLGAVLLAYVLYRHAVPALRVLEQGASAPLLVAFLVSVAATIVSLSWRWGYVMRGIGDAPPLLSLTFYRSAAHSIAVLIPSGKLGGDPLRAWLVARAGVAPAAAIAGVVIDRTIEIASTAPFSIMFAVILVQQEIPQSQHALVMMTAGTIALGVGAVVGVRRLRRGAGLVTAVVHSMRLDRLSMVDDRMALVREAENDVVRLVDQLGRLLLGVAAGLASNVLVVVEFALVMLAFGLPSDPVSIVAAIFATGASHMLLVPGSIGVLEGAQVWIFTMLGYGPETGLAVGLAVRLRELIWMLPGVVTLLAGSLRATAGRLGDDLPSLGEDRER